MTILSVDKLAKNYGAIKALKEVSFSVPKGAVFGILGPNGSGKTTLLGIVMSILKASGGTYKLFNEEPTDEHRKKIGTLLETPNFYHYLSAVQNLKITAAIKGRGEEDIERVLQMVNLLQRKNSAFSTYSLGMKQRLAIAAALLGNPDVLVFDEPTNGLDPVGIAEIRTLIKELAQQGKTIIMASHLLDEVEKVCSHVAILKQGNLVASGHVDEIFVHDDIVEISASDMIGLQSAANNLPGLLKISPIDGKLQLFFPMGTANLEQINSHCFSNGIVLNHLQVKRKSLESKFFELTNS
ncbi:MAG TPA: ATP-binding cassette domain-containing protein [Ferruginibacter sp.]|nr:ATP-binding cassette domain-containing protein [Ferruginibacter sp.]HRE62699.1 ATP-binding cassette domain-containing protein [Ferruginibacter sp.]